MFEHIHPHKPIFYKDTKAFICGTLPPPRFATNELKPEDVFIPYGSKDNLLWPILDEIYNLELSYVNTQKEINKRLKFLEQSKLGICDIVSSCKREKLDASDIGMLDIKCRDILSFLKKYKRSNTIILTGGSSKNSPLYFLKQILKNEGIVLNTVETSIPKEFNFLYDDRIINIIALTSPSNAANRFIGSQGSYKAKKKQNQKYSTFDFRLEQYKEVFLKYLEYER